MTDLGLIDLNLTPSPENNLPLTPKNHYNITKNIPLKVLKST